MLEVALRQSTCAGIEQLKWPYDASRDNGAQARGDQQAAQSLGELVRYAVRNNIVEP